MPTLGVEPKLSALSTSDGQTPVSVVVRYNRVYVRSRYRLNSCES